MEEIIKQKKAKNRHTLMRKLAGSTWGADSQTIKKCIPVMELGMTAFCASVNHTLTDPTEYRIKQAESSPED